MLIAYDSKTGNVRRFIEKMNARAVQIEEALTLNEPFVLVTYTTGFGQVPEKTVAFLQQNHKQMRGVCASGNRNWGEGFARSADKISTQYNVPIIHKFELSGTTRDVEQFQLEVQKVASY